MLYSKERQAALAHKIIAALKADNSVEWEEDPVTVRRAVVRLLAECEKAEQSLRQDAEQKVTQLKRNVPEGSQEFEILVRKHIQEAFDKLERFRVVADRS